MTYKFYWYVPPTGQKGSFSGVDPSGPDQISRNIEVLCAPACRQSIAFGPANKLFLFIYIISILIMSYERFMVFVVQK